MKVNQVKCRACGEIVEDTATSCPKCTCPDFERIEPETNPAQAAPALLESSGKTCPRCNIRNEFYAVVCECNYEFPTNVTIPESQEGIELTQPLTTSHILKAQPKLWLLIGAQAIECSHGDILGREGTLACDLFRPIPTVSGKHIAVELRNDGWFLINLPLQSGRTEKNITQVDGRLLRPGESLALSGEHIVRMSSRCELRLRVEVVSEGL